MIVQVTASSLVSENKTLCHPASVDSIPSSTDKEDHVSMGAWAVRKAARVLANSRRVLELELLAAAQGIDFLRPLKTSTHLEKIHALIRQQIPKLETDRILCEDFKKMETLTRSQTFLDLTRSPIYS
jgi:histidine ammonia-lyase